jgi:hypothetical protein
MQGRCQVGGDIPSKIDAKPKRDFPAGNSKSVPSGTKKISPLDFENF